MGSTPTSPTIGAARPAKVHGIGYPVFVRDEGPNVRRFKTSVSTPSELGERRANLVTAHRLVAAWAVALAVMVTVLVSILVAIAIEDVSWSSALPFLVCAV